MNLEPGESVTVSRQGIGFSSEIETDHHASYRRARRGRQGIGFSSEIETIIYAGRAYRAALSPGDWLLVRD